MRTLTLIAALAVSPTFVSVAEAAPTSADAKAAQNVLIESAKAEEEMMSSAIAALDSMNPLNVTDPAKASYAEAKTLHTAAVELWKAKQYREAYMKFREAGDKLEPALSEALGWTTVPQNVQDAGAKLVALDAARLDALAKMVGERGSPEAKTAYAEAKTLYTEAKTMWDGGQRRDASTKAWASLKKADVAVRETWQANAPAAGAAAH